MRVLGLDVSGRQRVHPDAVTGELRGHAGLCSPGKSSWAVVQKPFSNARPRDLPNNHNCDVVLQSTGGQTHASCKRIGCLHDGAFCRQGADSFGSYVLGQSVGRQKQPTTSNRSSASNSTGNASPDPISGFVR